MRQMYGHLPPILQTIKDEEDKLGTELMTKSYLTFFFKWATIHGRTSVDRPVTTFINSADFAV